MIRTIILYLFEKLIDWLFPNEPPAYYEYSNDRNDPRRLNYLEDTKYCMDISCDDRMEMTLSDPRLRPPRGRLFSVAGKNGEEQILIPKDERQ